LLGATGEEKWNPQTLNLLNRHLVRTVQAVALFVSWHYARGSQYETPFWHFAQANCKESLSRHAGTGLLADFQQFAQAGGQVPAFHLEHIRDTLVYEQEIKPRLTLNGEMGGFGVLSFAQIGQGIGAYPETAIEEVQQH
jgi:hypothetical protein